MRLSVLLTVSVRMLIGALSRTRFMLICAYSPWPDLRHHSVLTIHYQNQIDMKRKSTASQKMLRSAEYLRTMMNDSRHLLSAGLFAESLRTAGSGRFASALLAALNTAIAVDHCTIIRACGDRASIVGAASRHSRDFLVAP